MCGKDSTDVLSEISSTLHALNDADEIVLDYIGANWHNTVDDVEVYCHHSTNRQQHFACLNEKLSKPFSWMQFGFAILVNTTYAVVGRTSYPNGRLIVRHNGRSLTENSNTAIFWTDNAWDSNDEEWENLSDFVNITLEEIGQATTWEVLRTLKRDLAKTNARYDVISVLVFPKNAVYFLPQTTDSSFLYQTLSRRHRILLAIGRK